MLFLSNLTEIYCFMVKLTCLFAYITTEALTILKKYSQRQVTGLRKGQIVEKRLYLEDLEQKRYFMILGTSLAGLER